MVTNISESKRIEEERDELLRALDRRVKEFTVLHEVAQTATESLDLVEVLNKSLDKVTELMAVETAAILFANEQKGGAIAAACGSVSPKFLDKVKKLPIGYSITGRVALSGVPIVIEDVSKYPQLADMSVKQEGLLERIATAMQTVSPIMLIFV